LEILPMSRVETASAEPSPSRRQMLLFAAGAIIVGSGAGVAHGLWKRKDLGARLLNPFSLSHFDLPPIEGLVDAAGQPVPGFSDRDLAGKRSLLNLWASWCPSCREEHGWLTKIAEQTHVPIYGANVKDDPARARAFLARRGNPFAAVGADVHTYLERALGAKGVPASFVVGPGFKIEVALYDPLDKDNVRNLILPALTSAD
jgi:cytochrome c biogenesis protein CcmG, thiol:disulfide interchange protein DsbE